MLPTKMPLLLLILVLLAQLVLLLALPPPCVPADIYTSEYRPDGQTCAAKLATQSGKTNETSEGPVIGEAQAQGPPSLRASQMEFFHYR